MNQIYRESVFSPRLLAKMIVTFGLYYFWWRARTLSLNNGRVTYASGVFSRIERSIPLDRVQDVALQRSLLGRMLGYGNIFIESAGSTGGTEIVFFNVSAPTAVKEFLVNRRGRISKDF